MSMSEELRTIEITPSGNEYRKERYVTEMGADDIERNIRLKKGWFNSSHGLSGAIDGNKHL